MKPIDYLQDLQIKANQLNVRYLANKVLERNDFRIWSGSSKPEQHHYGNCGLLIHTQEVVHLCLLNEQAMNLGLDRQLVYLAALYHDIGKVWDYTPNMPHGQIDSFETLSELGDSACYNWSSTDHKYKIHHITRSALFFNENVHIDPKDEDEITHAILAHHGLREWGSPVTPKTKLAWLLHLCDNMSARMYDCGGLKMS